MLTQQLEKCNRFISLHPNDRPVYTTHYNDIRDYVITAMKRKNNLFNEIFRRTELSGSYADQLKVSKPDEYDVLMILKFDRPIVRRIEEKPGFVQINLMHGMAKYGTLLDDEGYLMQNRVLEFLRTIMKSIFPNRSDAIIIGHEYYIVSRSLNGPANTLNIQWGRNKNVKFSIDFVGALEFSVNDVWMADIRKERCLNKFWHAIPKPRKSTPRPVYRQMYSNRANVDAYTLQMKKRRNHNKNRDWICSYAAIERHLINDLYFIKPLIRIFKKIRDTHGLTNLKSYYINQIFIHQRMLKDVDYWKRPIGELLLEMFEVIIQRLDNKRLPSFWHTNFNLISHFHRTQIDDIKLKLRSIQQDVILIPEDIFKLILTDEEQRRFHRFV